MDIVNKIKEDVILMFYENNIVDLEAFKIVNKIFEDKTHEN